MRDEELAKLKNGGNEVKIASFIVQGNDFLCIGGKENMAG